jgi:hypothetical protein
LVFRAAELGAGAAAPRTPPTPAKTEQPRMRSPQRGAAKKSSSPKGPAEKADTYEPPSPPAAAAEPPQAIANSSEGSASSNASSISAAPRQRAER